MAWKTKKGGHNKKSKGAYEVVGRKGRAIAEIHSEGAYMRSVCQCERTDLAHKMDEEGGTTGGGSKNKRVRREKNEWSVKKRIQIVVPTRAIMTMGESKGCLSGHVSKSEGKFTGATVKEASTPECKSGRAY